MTTIIGIAGGKGSGKDTASDYLVENYGAVKYAFADLIKKLLIISFGLKRDQLYGTQDQKETVDPRYNLSPRQLMQRVGDGAREAFGDCFWVEKLFQQIVEDRPKLVVISDVRRVNEADRIWSEGTQYKQHPTHVWRLHYAPGLRRGEDLHASEQEWMKLRADLEITPGAGGLAELYASLDKACAMFGIVRVTRPTGRAMAESICADCSGSGCPACNGEGFRLHDEQLIQGVA